MAAAAQNSCFVLASPTAQADRFQEEKREE
jgi:hypothetical protein